MAYHIMIKTNLKNSKKFIIKSASTVLFVLKAFEKLPPSATLAEVAETVNLPKMKVFRALSTLVSESFLIQNPDNRKYRLHSNILVLANKLFSSQTIRIISHDRLQQLAFEIGEDIMVAVPGENLMEIIFVDRLFGGSRFTFYCDVGKKLPLHIGAAAKAVLAFLPDEDFEKYLNSFNPVKMSPHTIVSKQTLMEERNQIRKRGYSVSNQEVDEGVSAVGACIIDSLCFPVAGLAVTSLSIKMTKQRINKIGILLSKTAMEISTYFGYKEKNENNTR